MPTAALATQMVEFQEELGANYLHALLGFSALLEEQFVRDPSDSEGFMLLTSEALKHFDISTADFSEEFGVHPSTVSRWAAGKACPNRIVRPLILKWIAERIESEILNYQSNLSAIGKVDKRVQTKIDAMATGTDGYAVSSG